MTEFARALQFAALSEGSSNCHQKQIKLQKRWEKFEEEASRLVKHDQAIGAKAN